MKKHTKEEALFFHKRLPRRLWRALREAGLPEELVKRRLIGWNGKHMTVPVFGKKGGVARLKMLTDPLEEGTIRVVSGERFEPAEIYGWETLKRFPKRLFVAADPWERLLLEARGLPAIGLVGDPATFKESWTPDFQGVGEVFVAFPHVGRSMRAARRIVELIPQARFLYLPPEVMEGGLSEYFVDLGRGRSDFLSLLPPREEERDEGGD